MDDDPLLAEESDEEFRKMENDIDEFLSSIRENVSKNYPQSKATCSRVANEYDSISSDDLENQSSYNSVNNEPGLSRQPRKFNHNSSLNKKKQGWKQKKQGWRQKKWKDHGAVQKQWRSNSQEEKHDLKGKRFRQSSNKSYSHHPQDSFSPKEDDEYRWSPSLRRRDEFHLERSPRRNAYHHERTGFPRGRVEYFEELSLSPQERGYQEERKGRYGHKRRFSPERIEEQEHSQDSVIFDENFTCQHRTSGSRSSEMESIYHKIYAEESDSPSCWSEDEENYDYRDQHTDPHWKHEGDDLFMEDEDDYGSSAGSINTASFVTACLEKIVVSNPEIAEKFSNACMSLLNKSVGTTCDSDYEYEESSCGSFADQSGRISARNWRNSRSPSFSGGPPGPRNYRDRHEGSSRRIVVEYSQSPSPDRGHCSRYDQKRHTAPSSPTLSTKRRYSFNHHKSGREEDPKTSVIRSIKKIRKQCEEESNSTVRRALLALLKVHQKECDMYLRKPEAHPDYIKEYRVFLDKKSRSIIDLGGDPNDYDFQENWKKYWPTQLARLFRQSWDTKMHKCTSMLLKKGHLSKSLSTSSSKEVTSQPHKKKKGSKDTSEKNSEVKNQEHQKLEASSAAQCKTKKEEMDTELLNILKLLNHIKHKFKDCEASFDSFYQKALSFKQKNLDLSGILSSNLSLLEKIDTKLEETLEDEDLTLIQKAIIKETHERFQCFLKKSKESNSHVMKNYNDRNQVVAEEHHIECLVTDLHPSVVTSLHTKKVIPAVTCRTRTLTEISIQKPEIQQAPLTMTQEKHSHSDLTQPPPPGVTPPPPGVTPPPPGVTPPPLGVTPPPPGVTPPPLGVTPPFQSVSSPPSGVTPLSGTVITSLSHSVTSSINTECAKSPHHTTPAPSCNISIPLHIPASSPGVMPPPPGITPPPPGVTPPPPGVTPPPPGVTPPPPPLVSSSPPTTLSHQSLIIVPSQRSFPASKSLPVSNLPKSHDAAPKVTEHPSTTSTSAVQRSKPINNKDIIPVSQKQTQRIHQKSREFLRSTIKDCFLSTSSPIEERNLSTSTEEESITPDSKAGESAASSIPTLTEDILKMFVVKLEDKSETIAGNKSCDELNTSVVDTKPATKKRIKITIPQSSEKKRMPALNPILDDQELL